METVLTYYVVGALTVFIIWLSLFWEDLRTPMSDKSSWIVLLVATLLWPLSLPMSLIELSRKRREVSRFAPHNLLLGQLLKQAGLLSDSQIRKVLHEQQTQEQSQRFGEILARRGWLAQETVDFFVEELPQLKLVPRKQRLGEYLEAAKLLDREQVELILAEQQYTSLLFGEVAVRKGCLDRKTLNLILFYLLEESEEIELAYPV